MINDRAKRILSEGASANEERNIVFLIVFLEEGGLSYIFRLFRAGEDAGDPEQQAIRWMGRAKGLCRSAPGELSTGMIRSKDGERFMVAVSGREIEAKEWPREFDDSSRLSTGRQPHRRAPVATSQGIALRLGHLARPATRRRGLLRVGRVVQSALRRLRN